MDAPVTFSVKPTLAGSHVVLRPFTGADVEAMGPVLADPDVLRLTGSVHTTAAAYGRSNVLDHATRHWYETRAEQTNRLDLAIIERASDQCVGEAVLNEWQAENQSCNFRILIGPGGRDRGLGSQATRLLLAHAFTATDLYRIELEVYAFNPRAQHVYERAGFVVEGRRRAAFVFDGQRIDAITMAVLRTDWLAQKHHDARTAPPPDLGSIR